MTSNLDRVIALLAANNEMMASLQAQLMEHMKNANAANAIPKIEKPIAVMDEVKDLLYKKNEAPVTEDRKIWTRDQINDILNRSDAAVERAIKNLYKLQTDSEKHSRTTKVTNSYGFSAFHAKRGTYYAEWLNSGKNLTGKHLDKARAIALRHSSQLVDIANGLIKV